MNNFEAFVEKIEKQVVFFRQAAKKRIQALENMSAFNNSIEGIKQLDAFWYCGKLAEICV